MATTLPLSDDAFAVVVDLATMTGRGVQPNDRVIVEPVDVLAPTDGDLIAVVSANLVAVYEIWGAQLLPHGDPRYKPCGWDAVTSLGVCVEVSRQLRDLHR